MGHGSFLVLRHGEPAADCRAMRKSRNSAVFATRGAAHRQSLPGEVCRCAAFDGRFEPLLNHVGITSPEDLRGGQKAMAKKDKQAADVEEAGRGEPKAAGGALPSKVSLRNFSATRSF